MTAALPDGAARVRKEAFVSDLAGSTPLDVFYALHTALVGYLLLCAASRSRLAQPLPRTWLDRTRRLTVELVLLLAPFVVFLLLPAWPIARGAHLCFAAVTLGALIHAPNMRPLQLFTWTSDPSSTAPSTSAAPCTPCASALATSLRLAHKLLVLVTTAFMILAVDFPFFPRRLAKTEQRGVSVMDAGVGAFVVQQALASRFPMSRIQAGRRLRHTVAPLLLLGLARTAVLHVVGYPQHESEYGRHWNFFFTLASLVLVDCGVSLAASRLPPHFHQPAQAALGVAALALQHCLLYRWGGAEAVLTGQRGPSLLAANREGLASLPGFLALYYLAAAARPAIATHPVSSAATAMALFAVYSAQSHIAAPSRRLADPAFVLWMLATNSYLLATVAYIHKRFDITALENTSLLAHLCQRRGLVFFCMANLSTGIVNMATDTLTWPSAEQGLAVCLTHMLISALATLAAPLAR